METDCKATITLGDAKITFEGPADFVQTQVANFSGFINAGPPSADSAAGPFPSRSASREKQLVAEKRPRGHHEIATVLAFALIEAGAAQFTEDDIRRAYLRADVRPPKHVSQALRDAKSKFDYITTGSKRGMYRLTNHGDRTVRFDLPRSK